MKILEEDKVIGAVEAARILGVGRKTIYNWTKIGKIKPVSRLPGTHRQGNTRYSLEAILILKNSMIEEVEDAS